MKSLSQIGVLILMISLFASCEKVININLNDTEKRYVIEGNISNEGGNCTVTITQTKNFNEDNNFPGVTGAIVTVSDNGFAPKQLVETAPGKYATTAINGTIGHTYTLNINVAGRSFTSSSKMPVLVNLDSLYVEESFFFGDSAKVVNIKYNDPVETGNAYQFVQYKNAVEEKTIFVTNDDYTNGRPVTTPLFIFADDDEDKKLKKGDTIKIVMKCIDPGYYKYLYSIDAATGSSNNATPANPVSNISGGALGYFSAHTTQSKTLVVK